MILIKVGFDGGYLLQPKGSPMFGRANQFGALSLADSGTDFHPELEPALRANRIDHLYLCGVSTSWAIQAADRDYAITILEDACAAADASEHHGSLWMLGRIAEIITVAQLA